EALIDANPATTHKTRGQRGVSVHDRQRRHEEPRAALMPDDFRYIKGALQLSPHEYLVDVMSFALATGLRAGELCALRRLDVHLDEAPASMPYPVTGNIRIRSWNNPATGETFQTKTAKPRTVPLTPLAAQIAARHLALYETDDGQQRLLRARSGGVLDPSELSRHFARYRRQVGLTDRYTFHSTRHAFASWLMMLGTNLYSIKRLLGHKSLAQLDTYAELCEEFLLGNPRRIQREMISVLCPDLPLPIIERVLPERRSLTALLSDERFGAVQSLRSIIPMEEVLFGGIGYEVEALSF
ncbi:MAG: site-specific integrase, partial [Bacteroidetes bacterium]|nr:site-specific integrase [Bacteroidota bacterium]